MTHYKRIIRLGVGRLMPASIVGGEQHGRIVPLANIRDVAEQKAPDNAGALSFSKSKSDYFVMSGVAAGALAHVMR